MSFAFFAAALCMTIAAVALVVSALLREKFEAERRLDQWRLELKSLIAANSAGTLDSARFTAQRAAIGDALLEYIGSEPRRAAPTRYAALAVTILVPLAAFGGYKWVGTAPDAAPDIQAQGSNPHTAMPVDHGADMQSAIARLAGKLRQNPDDAQGWVLLGRTYKATQHYPEARDAFKHAFDAAPGDAALEREYAAAETPDVGPEELAEAEPQQCDVPGFNAQGSTTSLSSACTETSAPPHNSAGITVKVALAI